MLVESYTYIFIQYKCVCVFIRIYVKPKCTIVYNNDDNNVIIFLASIAVYIKYI